MFTFHSSKHGVLQWIIRFVGLIGGADQAKCDGSDGTSEMVRLGRSTEMVSGHSKFLVLLG